MSLPAPLTANATLAVVPAVLLVAYPIFKRVLRSYVLKNYTCLPDLEKVGTPRKGAKIRGTAVVCGGSVGGLFAARICSDHFEKVVVVEPEAWTFTDEARQPANFDTREVKSSKAIYNTLNHNRSRVYQYSAVHVYQALFLRFARKIFPGFDDIAKSWAMLICPMDVNFSLSGHQLRLKNAPESILAPRRNMEPLIRKLVCEGRPEIEFVHGTVTGFQLAPDGATVDTVNVRLASGETRDFTDCALALDCTGSSQSGLKLLSRAIPALPADLRQTYSADIVYATLEYPVPPNFDEDLRTLGVPGNKEGVKAGVLAYIPNPNVDNHYVALVRCDANRVVFTMGGWGVDMPVTLDEIREFSKAVKNQDHIPEYFYKTIDLLEPVKHLGTVYESRISNCYKVDYVRAANVLPRNFVALGDSSMRVNPRFGQGVSKCAMGAISLDSILRRMSPSDRNFGKMFFKKMDVRTQEIWDGTRFADYAAPSTTPVPGETRETGRYMRWYNDQLIKLVDNDSDLADKLWQIQMFLVPAIDVLAPSIVARVIWSAMTSKD